MVMVEEKEIKDIIARGVSLYRIFSHSKHQKLSEKNIEKTFLKRNDHKHFKNLEIYLDENKISYDVFIKEAMKFCKNNKVKSIPYQLWKNRFRIKQYVDKDYPEKDLSVEDYVRIHVTGSFQYIKNFLIQTNMPLKTYVHKYLLYHYKKGKIESDLVGYLYNMFSLNVEKLPEDCKRYKRRMSNVSLLRKELEIGFKELKEWEKLQEK